MHAHDVVAAQAVVAHQLAAPERRHDDRGHVGQRQLVARRLRVVLARAVVEAEHAAQVVAVIGVRAVQRDDQRPAARAARLVVARDVQRVGLQRPVPVRAVRLDQHAGRGAVGILAGGDGVRVGVGARQVRRTKARSRSGTVTLAARASASWISRSIDGSVISRTTADAARARARAAFRAAGRSARSCASVSGAGAGAGAAAPSAAGPWRRTPGPHASIATARRSAVIGADEKNERFFAAGLGFFFSVTATWRVFALFTATRRVAGL